jgi:hypothetical protein
MIKRSKLNADHCTIEYKIPSTSQFYFILFYSGQANSRAYQENIDTSVQIYNLKHEFNETKAFDIRWQNSPAGPDNFAFFTTTTTNQHSLSTLIIHICSDRSVSKLECTLQFCILQKYVSQNKNKSVHIGAYIFFLNSSPRHSHKLRHWLTH